MVIPGGRRGRSPVVELSTGSSKLSGGSFELVHRRVSMLLENTGDGRESLHSLQSLIFYLPVTQHKPAHSLVKEGQTLVHWSLSTGAATT